MNRIWEVFPKYVCWKFWLARNQIVFQDERVDVIRMAG